MKALVASPGPIFQSGLVVLAVEQAMLTPQANSTESEYVPFGIANEEVSLLFTYFASFTFKSHPPLDVVTDATLPQAAIFPTW